MKPVKYFCYISCQILLFIALLSYKYLKHCLCGYLCAHSDILTGPTQLEKVLFLSESSFNWCHSAEPLLYSILPKSYVMCWLLKFDGACIIPIVIFLLFPLVLSIIFDFLNNYQVLTNRSQYILLEVLNICFLKLSCLLLCVYLFWLAFPDSMVF